MLCCYIFLLFGDSHLYTVNYVQCYISDGIMIISVIVQMLTNYLGMTLIYMMAACFFPGSEGVYVNAKLRIL